MKQAVKGNAYLVIAAVFFGSYGVWSRFLGSSFGDFFQAWTRCLLVLCLLLPVGIATKSFTRIKKQDSWWYVLVSVAGALTFAPYFYAFTHLSIGTATLLFYASFTLGNYFLGKFSFNESFDAIKIWSLILALLGLLSISYTSFATPLFLPTLAVLFGGIAGSVEVVFTKKISQNYSPIQITTSVWGAGFLLHFPISLLAGEPQVGIALTGPWLAQVAYAIAQIGAFLFVVLGFKYAQPSVGGIVGLLEIPFAFLFSYLVFGETIAPHVFFGGLLIVLAASLPNIVALKKK
jgi:drug/metabolite transporter (DMT)-like permease